MTRTYVVRRADAADTGGLVARRWAQQKVAALSVFPEQNHDALLATGRQFGLVTPGTSLLVLETLEQHLSTTWSRRASRKALHAEYQPPEGRRGACGPAGAGRTSWTRVAAMWQERSAGGRRTFPRRA